MATAEDIATVRDHIAEPDDSNGWTAERIGVFIDAAPDLSMAAANIWGSKAGEYATLVDVSENGSSRKLSEIHKNALSMQRVFIDRSIMENGSPSTSRPRTRAIVRP